MAPPGASQAAAVTQNCSEQIVAAPPCLAPVPSDPETVTQTVRLAEQFGSGEALTTALPAVDAAQNCSEQIAKAPLGSPACTPLEAQPEPEALHGRPTSPQAGAPSAVRTIELLFFDKTMRRAPFHEAVHREGDRWYLRSYTTPALSRSPSLGRGLAGSPGRWQEFYLDRRPSDFGLDPDLAVLYWDDAAGSAYVADADLLQAALGADWRAKLRALRA